MTDEIDTVGVYDGIADAVYHSDPVAGGSLTSTELRRLVCPARYRWFRDNPQPYNPAFEFGHAAHRLALGAGADIVVIDHDSWRTKAAKEARDEAMADFKTPILVADWLTVQAMAAALREHPVAVALLDPARGGRPEQTLVWKHHLGPMARARADWFPNIEHGRVILTDYKTARSAEPRDFGRAAAAYGYHQQVAWYLDGVRATCGVTDPAFVFIVQEKDPPYLVNVIELDEVALKIGQARNEAAVGTFIECTRTGVWPGYGPDVELVSLPRWAEYQFDEEQEASDDAVGF